MTHLTPQQHQELAFKERKSLVEVLSRCSDEDFLRMVWAINMIQSDYSADVKPYFQYPHQAKTSDMNTVYSVYKWELETLVSLLFSENKNLFKILSRQKYECGNYNSVADVVNRLRKLENHESGAYLNQDNIDLALHRIAHRQFGWQRGFATYERIYRFVYVYGQAECADFFKEKYDVTIYQFIITGFYLYAQLQASPCAEAVPIEKIKINKEIIGKVLDIISCSIPEMREKTKLLHSRYKLNENTLFSLFPSVIRNFPIIINRNKFTYMSPLPQLIMQRITSGLYYDISTGSQQLITGANQRFEDYVRHLIQAFLPQFNVLPSQKYGPKKHSFDSPDVLIENKGEISVVIECKATKLTYAAQYGDDPINNATTAYSQLIKGVVQLWTFFSHVRRGIYNTTPVSDYSYGILLTMDSWVQLSAGIQRMIIKLATEKIKDDTDIIKEDMKAIIFCPMQELSDILFITDEKGFLETLQNASKERYFGHSILSVMNDTKLTKKQRKFPFKLGDLMPEFNEFDFSIA